MPENLPDNLGASFLEESQRSIDENAQTRIAGLRRKFQGFTKEPQSQTVPNAPADSSYMFNVAKQVPAGAYTAVNNSIRSAEDLAGWLDDNLFGDMVTTDRIFDFPDTDKIFAAPQGTVAGLTRGATQFLVGFIPILKGMRAYSQGRRILGILGAEGLGPRFVQASVAGFIADYTVWDPKHPNMSSLINENVPQLANPISEYLATDLDDAPSEARLKNAIEGMFLGTAAEGVFRGIRLLKANSAARSALIEGAEGGVEGGAKGVGKGVGKGVISEGVQETPTVGKALKKAPKDVKVDFVTEGGTYFTSKKTGQRYVMFKGQKEVFRVKPGAVIKRGPKGVTGKTPSDVPPRARTAPANSKGLVRETAAGVKGEGVVVGNRKLFVEYDNIREGFLGLEDLDVVVKGWMKIMRKFTDPQTLKEIEAKVVKLGFVLEDIKSGFTGPTNEWSVYLRALMKMSDEAIISFKALNERAYAGDAAARAVWAKRLALTDAIELFAAGKRSDAARALWVSRINDRGNIVFWKAVKDNIDMEFETEMAVDTAIERIHRLIQNVDDIQLGQFMKQVVRPGMWDLFMELWINSILSGPRTLFAVNPIGNISTAATSPIERFLGGVLKPLSRTATTGTKTTITTAAGKTEKVFLSVQKGEAWAMVLSWADDLVTMKRGVGKLVTGGHGTLRELQKQEGILKNWAQSSIDMGRMIKKAFDAESRLGGKGTKVGLPTTSRDVINAKNLKIILSEDFGLRHLGVNAKVSAEGLFAKSIDFIGKAIRLPGKILVSTDDLFKGIVDRMEIHAEAWRQATMEGYTGAAFSKRFAVLKQNSDLIKGAAKRAKAQGELRTFTNELDGWGKSIQSFANSHPSARLIVPFVRTPINIGTYSLKRTPGVNMFWKETRDAVLYGKGGMEADLVRGQFALGVTVTAGVAYMASEGIITGTGPRSATQRNLMRQAGWQPLSVHLGTGYYSFNRFDPWAITLGIVADIVHMGGKVPNKTYDEMALMVVTAMARNFTAKTYLQGMSNFFEMISDPPRAHRHITRTLASFVPFTSLLRQTESLVDPTLRETRGVLDEVYAGIVGLSDKLPPSRNLRGDPVILPPGVGPFGIIPLYVSNDNQNPVWKEMMRNQAKIGMPQQTIYGTQVPLIALEEGSVKQGILLSPEEYDEYVRLAGNELKINGKGMWDTLEWMVEQEFYNEATDGPDGGKVALMARTVKFYRQAARTQLLADHPLIRDKATELDKERYMAKYGDAGTLSATHISF